MNMDEIEEEYSKAVFIIEKELGHFIDDNYPVMKFLEEMRLLNWYKEQEKLHAEGIH
jgi:hypothetical protein